MKNTHIARLVSKKILQVVLGVMVLLSAQNVWAEAEVVPNKPFNQTNAVILQAKKLSNLSKKLQEVNEELVSRNVMLQQENNELQTQVDVLVAERTNQIFLTGALVTLISLLLGFFAAWMLLKNKKTDW